jgi:hypothetical protein
MSWVLRYTNIYGQVYFFANLGGPWESDPTKRLVERTVLRPDDARKFDTEEEANTTRVSFNGHGPTESRREGWEIVTLP